MFESNPVGELLTRLLTLLPDAFVMATLAGVDVAALSDVDAVTYLQLHQRVTAWWMSRQFAAVLVAASPEPLRREGIVLAMDSEDERSIWIEEWRREELALALRLPPSTAQDLIDKARLLAGPLPRTREALRGGEITDRHVAAIAKAADRLPGRWQRTPEETAEFSAACAELERRVLSTARRATVAKTTAAANRAVLVIDAEGERCRRQPARRRPHPDHRGAQGAGPARRRPRHRSGGGSSCHEGGREPSHRPAHLPRPRRRRSGRRGTTGCGPGRGGGGPGPARGSGRRGHLAPARHRPDHRSPA